MIKIKRAALAAVIAAGIGGNLPMLAQPMEVQHGGPNLMENRRSASHSGEPDDWIWTAGGWEPVETATTVAQSGPRGFPVQELEGRVVGVDRRILTDSAKTSQEHTLVRLRTADGTFRWIDLGPSSDVTAVPLAGRGWMDAWGRFGTIDGRPVFMAEQVQLNGGEIHVTRRPALSQDQVWMRGIVDSVNRTSLTERQGDHVVQLRFADGRQALVDLGPGFRPAEFDRFRSRTEGALVELVGPKDRVKGEYVIRPDRFWVRGIQVLQPAGY